MSDEPEIPTIPEVVEPVAEAPPPAEQQADDAAPEGEEAEPLQEAEKPRKNGVSERIDELTRKLRTAERALEEARSKGAQDSADAAKKPTADQFDDYADFVEALTDWKVGKQITETTNAQSQRDAEVTRTALWEERQAQARQSIPDYSDVVEKSELLIKDHVAALLMESEAGPQLAYHLAQNASVAEKLNGMSERQAAMEMGRIEAKLSAPVQKPTTKAPAPISPISGGNATTTNLQKAGMEEYIAERRRQGAKF